MNEQLQVTGIENQGTIDHPYGFIHFNDGTRLAWLPSEHSTNDMDDLFSSDVLGDIGEDHFMWALAAIAMWKFKAKRQMFDG